jgi:hypothetical protein
MWQIRTILCFGVLSVCAICVVGTISLADYPCNEAKKCCEGPMKCATGWDCVPYLGGFWKLVYNVDVTKCSDDPTRNCHHEAAKTVCSRFTIHSGKPCTKENKIGDATASVYLCDANNVQEQCP